VELPFQLNHLRGDPRIPFPPNIPVTPPLPIPVVQPATAPPPPPFYLAPLDLTMDAALEERRAKNS